MSNLYKFDQSFRSQGYNVIAGVDEAGRGPIAGPVVASAVIIPTNVYIEGINDSKQLSSKQHTILYNQIIKTCEAMIGIVTPQIIDKINILEASKMAMLEALSQLFQTPNLILIDYVKLPLDIESRSITKGDEKSVSIAAASIVAKKVRDVLMFYYHSIYPQYGFDKHKGYPTKKHKENLKRYGPCPLHRESFKTVKDLITY